MKLKRWKLDSTTSNDCRSSHKCNANEHTTPLCKQTVKWLRTTTRLTRPSNLLPIADNSYRFINHTVIYVLRNESQPVINCYRTTSLLFIIFLRTQYWNVQLESDDVIVCVCVEHILKRLKLVKIVIEKRQMHLRNEKNEIFFRWKVNCR